MSNMPSIRTIVINLMLGAVPERAGEISDLWRRYDPIVEVAGNSVGVTMEADSRCIRFDEKTINLFWLFSFSAWSATEVYAPAALMTTLAGVTLEAALRHDPDLAHYEFDYRQRMNAVQSLISAQEIAEIAWPPDIPKPTADRNSFNDMQDVSAFDFSAMALAFALLHEFRHVRFRQEGDSRLAPPEEELACDTWAREFMMSQTDLYAKNHHEDRILVEQKRANAISLAALTIHALTPTSARWGDSNYPPIAKRLTAMISGSTLPDTSRFWMFTACLLIGLMRQEHRPLDFTARSNREMVEMLLDLQQWACPI